MDLFTLFYGNSKSRMKPIMTDSRKKCENYMESRMHSCKGFHEIRIAEDNSEVWRKKSCTIGGNNCQVPKINRQGKTSRNGWIGKNGFSEHT